MEMFTQTSSSRCTSASGRTLLDEALEKFSDKHSSQNSINAMQVTVTRSKSSIARLASPSRTIPDLTVKSTGCRSRGRLGGSSRQSLQRSKTSMLSTPARHCDACAMEHIRNWRKMNSATCLDDSSGMQKSNCDIHSQDGSAEDIRPSTAAVFTGERTPVFMVPSWKYRPLIAHDHAEVFLPLATVPKTGMIKLTSLEHEHRQPDTYYHHRQQDCGDISVFQPELPARRRSKKSLISRRDILEQLRIGNLRLEEEERRKAMDINLNKAMEDYTFGELQSTVIQYAEECGRKSSLAKRLETQKLCSKQRMMDDKNIALPAIGPATYMYHE